MLPFQLWPISVYSRRVSPSLSPVPPSHSVTPTGPEQVNAMNITQHTHEKGSALVVWPTLSVAMRCVLAWEVMVARSDCAVASSEWSTSSVSSSLCTLDWSASRSDERAADSASLSFTACNSLCKACIIGGERYGGTALADYHSHLLSLSKMTVPTSTCPSNSCILFAPLSIALHNTTDTGSSCDSHM